jgi:hypothetical protein
MVDGITERVRPSEEDEEDEKEEAPADSPRRRLARSGLEVE